MNNITIRTAEVTDAESILKIYAYYVENTAISYEYQTPSLEEFRERIANTLKKYPYLVILQDNKIVGYAYAGPVGSRAAFNWVAEVSIYIDRNARRGGFGRKIYEALEDRLREMGIVTIYALVAYPTVDDDEYLTKNSAEFHEHLGFQKVGELHKCGYKFGRWYNLLWMEKRIGEYEFAF